MGVDIEGDKRTAIVKDDKIILEIEQQQIYDIENVYHMIKAWEVQIASMDEWQKNYLSGDLKKTATKEIETELASQKEFFEGKKTDLMKGLNEMKPAFNSWSKSHPKEYSILMKKVQERNQKTKKRAIKQLTKETPQAIEQAAKEILDESK